MRVEVIPQVGLGTVRRVRVGDVLNTIIADPFCHQFRFAVAYMRVSGLDRLGASIDALLNRGGSVLGVVGIDDGITSIEALEALRQISSSSTVFYTISGFIYHPKLYLMNGERQAVAVVGSANLTRDGLFRNVELATAIHLDFQSAVDLEVYNRYDAFITELLNTANPNVQLITDSTLQTLANTSIIKQEAQVREPGPGLRSRRTKQVPTGLESLFPPLHVPVAPPARRLALSRPVRQPSVIVPPTTVGTVGTFIMQLSAFDSSHRTGVPGTPEVLIPHAAIGFFPPLAVSVRTYPDSLFDAVLNTPTGRERHRYRLWYYEERATGTRIDEYRLRLNHDTIDLSAPGGGDLLVINKLPAGSDPSYEVTIVPKSEPTFPAFLSLCGNEAQGKKWGMA